MDFDKVKRVEAIQAPTNRDMNKMIGVEGVLLTICVATKA